MKIKFWVASVIILVLNFQRMEISLFFKKRTIVSIPWTEFGCCELNLFFFTLILTLSESILRFCKVK